MRWDISGRNRSLDIPHITQEAGPTITPAGAGDILVTDGAAGGGWLSMPISSEEVGILRTLPRSARDEFQKNVHEYIGQIGQEHGTQTTGKE